MNLMIFVSSLDRSERNELRNILAQDRRDFPMESYPIRDETDRRKYSAKCADIRSKFPLDDDEQRMMSAGHNIDAIKSVRYRLSCSLKEAKDIIDAHREGIYPAVSPT